MRQAAALDKDITRARVWVRIARVHAYIRGKIAVIGSAEFLFTPWRFPSMTEKQIARAQREKMRR
jgi:hypothetical protein